MFARVSSSSKSLSARCLSVSALQPSQQVRFSSRYTAREFPNLKKLEGISQPTLETHVKLYQGYVTNTNKLLDNMAEIRKAGENKPTNIGWAEQVRRLGFEYDGMVLHEYYFENMVHGAPKLPQDSSLMEAIKRDFGSFDAWEEDFASVAALRGVGWAILYKDPVTGHVSNHWINEHEVGHPAGYKPLMVLDVWEHAFIKDYAPAERPKYIEAFLKQANWDIAQARFEEK